MAQITQDTTSQMNNSTLSPDSSHWWGFAALPDSLEFPTHKVEYDDGSVFDDPMTLVCQINCAQYKREHTENPNTALLPDDGMLYVFAYLDYFFGDLDADCGGMHPWDSSLYRVFYSPTCDDLHVHTIVDEDGNDFCTPPLAMQGAQTVLAEPVSFSDEVRQDYPGQLCLVQIDSLATNGLNFFDCGVLFFMISPEDLKAKRFDRTSCQLYSL